MTPLHIACQVNNGNMPIVMLLLNNKANPNAMNIIERTPLHFAGGSGRPDIGSKLIEFGAKSDAMDVHGESFLHYICIIQ